MGWPRFCIINGKRAVKAVRAEDGGLRVLEYVPAKDEYKPALALLHRLTFGDIDTDLVSEEEFEAFVARQREQTKRRCDRGPKDA